LGGEQRGGEEGAKEQYGFDGHMFVFSEASPLFR
jgi:hypothetical protein